MGSKKNYSLIVGVRDVAHLLLAFQEINTCILELSMSVTVRSGIPDLSLLMTAFTIDPVSAARVPFASSQCSLLASGFQTMDSAITFSLYQLDAQIAVKELEATTKVA